MAGTQALEEMEVTEHFWLLSCCCNRSSLKDASMTVTIFGIILGIFILVGGAGGSFFIALLYSAFSNLERTRVSTLQLSVDIGTGVALLLNGSGLVIYNILLLKRVKKNDAGAVFKTVKLGCLIFLHVQLIIELVICVVSLILLADPEDSNLQLSHKITMLVSGFLGLLLTLLVLCAIHMVKPKMLNVYIYILTILNILAAIIFTVLSFVVPYSPLFPLSWIVDRFLVSYLVNLLALHFIMLTIPPPPKNQHQLQHFDV